MERHYIGVDLHKAFFQACVIDQTGRRLWEDRFPRSSDGVAAFASRWPEEAPVVAVEASGPTWHFVDAVTARGARACVVDTRKTKIKAGYAAKTDRLDARRLADALRRESVVSIYIPPPAIRELRDVCRGRQQIVRVRTRLVQTIRALLVRQGSADPPVRALTSQRGLAWLATVHLPGASEEVLRRLERLLRTVHAEAVAATVAVRDRAAADPVVTALTDTIGIGPILGLMIRAEVGAIDRFANGPALACYAGLVPRVERSAERSWHGRITRDGSPWLRWALVEAARHNVKRTDATGRWARRLAMRTGMLKARVALARVLCQDIVRIWRTVL
jgi:transposase